METQSADRPRLEVHSHVVQTSKGPLDVLESGQGPPILYFHGTGAGAEIVPPWEHALIDEGFRLIVPNRPGYNGTPLSCGRTPSDCADLAAELLERLRIDRVAAIGLYEVWISSCALRVSIVRDGYTSCILPIPVVTAVTSSAAGSIRCQLNAVNPPTAVWASR